MREMEELSRKKLRLMLGSEEVSGGLMESP